MTSMSSEQIAHLAGFYDGEGCISIIKYKRRESTNPSYTLRSYISQAGDRGKLLLNKWSELIGLGSVYIARKPDTCINWDKTYQWLITGQNCKPFLEYLFPYLELKRDEAKLALEFLDYESKNRHFNQYSIDQNVLDKREEYYLKLRGLKSLTSSSRGRGNKNKQLHT